MYEHLINLARKKKEKEGRGSVGRRKGTDIGGVYQVIGLNRHPMNCSFSEKTDKIGPTCNSIIFAVHSKPQLQN